MSVNDTEIIWFTNEDYVHLLGSSTSTYSEHRILHISPTNDPKETKFPNNRIKTNKYSLVNFLPKNLFEQFRRVANFYFLITAIIAFSIDSPVSPMTSSLPLAFVILVTACKQGYEDWVRYKLDQQVNRALVTVIRNKCVQDIYCEKLVVGDLIKVVTDQDVPCDMILLASSDLNGSCYITTSNLDGETNLKTLSVPKVVASLDLSTIVSMEAVITCEHPTTDLYSYNGKLEVTMNEETTVGYLDADNLLLRGARLKDTEFVVGCAVYTGQDTKLSMNSKIAMSKFSTAEKSINRYLILFIIILMLEIIFAAIMKNVIELNANWVGYLGEDSSLNPLTFFVDVLSFSILFNYIVPISLYTTAEMQKFIASLFFGWDLAMYDEEMDLPACANTSDLNEELGQVDYLFTDKTGTLTENLMVFRRCSVGGKAYLERDCDGNLYELPLNGDDNHAIEITSWSKDIWHFMIAISLCHDVRIAPQSRKLSVASLRSNFRASFREKKTRILNSSLLMHPDLPEYQAASADEKALVEASARCGCVFQKYRGDEMEIDIKGKILKFKKLETLEFTSDRKRMSVIVKDAAGDIWLYCKGADSSVYPLITGGTIRESMDHVNDFSARGLRTLVIGVKKLQKCDYERLSRSLEQARQLIGAKRNAHVEQCYLNMERGLKLLGVTAVEDRLQEGVEETLESLRGAGIKVWVLTGDKVETAENIAFLCGHFKKGTEILRLMNEFTSESCGLTLTNFDRKIKLDPERHYGIIMDGASMAVANRDYPDLLRDVSMSCESVVCCRMSPLQKCEMVELVKQHPSRPLTAAIGDGGNDVSMIQEAHVGIGIAGKEGRQATMTADFAFAKFRFLRRALLVHGHWYYVRISVLVQYFFYKNLLLTTPQLMFSIHSGFSTQVLFDGMFLMTFNVIFTSVPIVFYGIFDQDYDADKLLQYPQLYKLYKKNYLLSPKQFCFWTVCGIWHACVCYFVPYVFWIINPVALHDSTPGGLWSYGTLIFYNVVILSNIKILLHSTYWTVLFLLSVVLSNILFILFALVYSSFNINYDGDMLMVSHKLFMSPTFWLLTAIAMIMSLMPDCIFLIYLNDRPSRVRRKLDSAKKSSLADLNCIDVDQKNAFRTRRRFLKFHPWKNSISFTKIS